MLNSIIDIQITIPVFAICTAVSLVLGLGTAREIGMIFLAMAIGLATGMGYVTLAILFFVVIAVFVLALSVLRFGSDNEHERELKITIPETLDYDGLFDDLFQKYTRSAQLYRVKTTNMGTLYELDYHVVLKTERIPKEFLDELRCRNLTLFVAHLIFRLMLAYEKSVATSVLNNVEDFLLQSANHNAILIQIDTT